MTLYAIPQEECDNCGTRRALEVNVAVGGESVSIRAVVKCPNCGWESKLDRYSKGGQGA